MSMPKRVLWRSPSLCGCEFSIVANWTQAPQKENGVFVSYQHPIPFSILSIEVVNLCPNDAAAINAWTLPADPYNGAPGYLKVPPNPTNPEKAYIYLYRYSANLHRLDTCDCKTYNYFDRFDAANTQGYIPHPVHTEKCSFHVGDYDDHAIALTEMRVKNLVLGVIAEEYPFAKDVTWTYDDERTLVITAPDLSDQEKDAVKGKVISDIPTADVIDPQAPKMPPKNKPGTPKSEIKVPVVFA